jgi:hypothetical protein
MSKKPNFHYIKQEFSVPPSFKEKFTYYMKVGKCGVLFDNGFKGYDLVTQYVSASINIEHNLIHYVMDPPTKNISENKEVIKSHLLKNKILVLSTTSLDATSKRRLLKATFQAVLELKTIGYQIDFILGFNTFSKGLKKDTADNIKQQYLNSLSKINISQNYYEEM